MNLSFALRHVRAIVGVFVLGALALILLALLFVAREQRWFERQAEVAIRFPAQNSGVLRVNVPVRLAGDPVGKVTAVDRTAASGEDGVVVARVRLLASARELLRKDAKARLLVPLGGIMGELSIDLQPGSHRAGPLPAGEVIRGEAEGDPANAAKKTLAEVQESVPKILAKVDTLLGRVDALLAEVKENRTATHADEAVRALTKIAQSVERAQVVAKAAKTVEELTALLHQVRAGGGSAGRLLSDDAFLRKLERLLDDVHGSWSRFDDLAGSSAKIAGEAAALAAKARAHVDDVDGLLAQVRFLTFEASRTLALVNQNWLLGGGVPGDPDLPAPPAVLDGGAEKEVRP